MSTAPDGTAPGNNTQNINAQTAGYFSELAYDAIGLSNNIAGAYIDPGQLYKLSADGRSIPSNAPSGWTEVTQIVVPGKTGTQSIASLIQPANRNIFGDK